MKPLLVLVLVIAAIGALIFAVMNMGGSKVKPDEATIAVQPTPAETTHVPPDLATPDKTDRKSEQLPPKPTPIGKAEPIQYENKVTGVVKNSLGEPVTEAEVMLTTESPFMNDPRPDPANEPRARTNEEGRYTFLGIKPATNYLLIVTHPQYAMKRETSMPVDAAGTIEQAPIILTAGGTLSGYVSDETGLHLADATLYLDGESYISINGEIPPDRLTTKTNQEGWYSFINVPAGQRTVAVTAPGYGKIQVGGFAFTKDEQYSRDFTLKMAEMIAGRVVGAGNDPVADANVIGVAVSHTQQSGMMTVKTDAKGEFMFENLVPGDYNVIANAKGWRMVPGRTTTRVKTGTSNLIIEMMKEATISGVVLDGQTGSPVKEFGVRLRFFFGDNNPTSAASPDFLPVTNDKGEFTIETPGPSDFVVEATAAGYAPSFSPSVNIAPGKSVTNLIVKLGRGGAIQGRVVDPEGKPVARALVTTQDNTWTDDEFTRAIGAQFPTNASTVEARTDESGRFTCTGLNPEVYQLVVTAAGFTTLSVNNIRVSEGGVTPAGDLKMLRGGTVRGTLFDASGKPVVGGTIRLRALDGLAYVNKSTKTGADGKFTISSCPAGRFQLSGMRAGGMQGNPFEELMDSNASQTTIIVAEGDTTTQDLRLQE